MIDRKFPDGYWPRGMDSSAQYRSMDDFSKSIYPIWRGIQKKDQEAESKLSSLEVSRPGQVLFECRTMHKQDEAIYASGTKPQRTDGNQEKMAALRQKAVRAAGK